MGHLKQLLAFLSWTLLIILGTAGVAHAQFQPGDLFVSVGNGEVRRYDSGGTLQETLDTGTGGFTTGMAFDAAGNLYVTTFLSNTLVQFDTMGNLTNSDVAAGLSTPESVVFDAAGDFYVGNLGNGIRKYDAAGAFLGTVTPVANTRVDWFDLSADQSTFIYGDEGTNILTVSNGIPGVSGPDFANSYGGNRAFAMRFLPDGGVLLADLNDVKRFDAAGNHIRTYDITGEDTWFSLNLDPGGTTFWAGTFGTGGTGGTSGKVYKFDIAAGGYAPTDTPVDNQATTGFNFLDTMVVNNLQDVGVTGVAIFGEPTAGGPQGVTPLPEPNTLALLGLGIGGLIGIGRIKRREGK